MMDDTGRSKPPLRRFLVRLLACLGSPKLTLWLLGLLAAAMAAGTVIPQQAPPEAYQRAFGDWLGGHVARSSWRHLYSAWWFIGGFALLGVNLVACIAARLPSLVRSADRSQVTAWGPLLVHAGIVMVLIGAAYGHLPGRSFHEVATLYPGQSSVAMHGGARITLRLAGAGMKQERTGQDTDLWARVEAADGRGGARAAAIRPSHPLRLAGFTVVLQRLLPEQYRVEVRRGDFVIRVPVTFTAHGRVDPMRSLRPVPETQWVVLVHSLRAMAGSPNEMEARVYLHRTGKMGAGWEDVGWVTTGGVSHAGARFRLVATGMGAEFSVDRDPSLPVVWAGCGLVIVGALLVAGGPRAGGSARHAA